MKKFFLSATLIFGFVLYAIYGQTPSSAIGLPNIQQNNSAIVSPISASTVTNLNPTGVAVNSNPPSGSPTPTPQPTPTPTPVIPPKQKGQYRNGTYTGSVADAFYGNVQVRATIAGGKLVDVIFLDHPQDRSTSVYINSQAMPYLKQEAIQSQSANVNIVTGATATSQAFVQSLGSALSQAAI